MKVSIQMLQDANDSLSTRSRRALANEGVYNRDQLRARLREQGSEWLRRIENVGRKSVSEILAFAEGATPDEPSALMNRILVSAERLIEAQKSVANERRLLAELRLRLAAITPNIAEEKRIERIGGEAERLAELGWSERAICQHLDQRLLYVRSMRRVFRMRRARQE